MDYITVTAKTLDDAITDALVQLGVTSDKLDYEVIEKGSAGFLGIGMKQAVIKARRKEEPVEEVVVEKPVENKVEEKPVEKEVKVTKEHKKSEKRSFHKKEKSEKEDKVEKNDSSLAEESVVRKEVELATVEENTISACKTFITDVLASMGMEEVTVTAEIDEEGALCINMDGPNMGIMIGKRGQTLDSLQYLTNRVANKM